MLLLTPPPPMSKELCRIFSNFHRQTYTLCYIFSHPGRRVKSLSATNQAVGNTQSFLAWFFSISTHPHNETLFRRSGLWWRFAFRFNLPHSKFPSFWLHNWVLRRRSRRDATRVVDAAGDGFSP